MFCECGKPLEPGDITGKCIDCEKAALEERRKAALKEIEDYAPIRFLETRLLCVHGEFRVETRRRNVPPRFAPDMWYYESDVYSEDKVEPHREVLIATDLGSWDKEKALAQHMDIIRQLDATGTYEEQAY